MAGRKRLARGPTRGERNCEWIERYCRVPEGKDVGKPLVLRPWQRAFVCAVYDNPAGTRRAILSMGRKNAKTALSACLLLLHLSGPEARPNSQLFSAAQSREQAAILFALATKIVRQSPDLHAVVQIRETAKQLACPELGTLYRALSAEASTAYGFSPVFTVHDELGQVRGPRSELYEALETAAGAQEAPLSIVISTQAPNDGDLLSVLIDDALRGEDPRVVISLHTAPLDLDPFTDEAIAAANPAFGDFQNADEVRAMAQDARRMPSREPEYRNLVLNQRVEMRSPFVSRTVWMACAGDPEPYRGEPVWIGLDLSSVRDLTAAVAVWQVDGVWQVRPMFWLPEQGVRERARADRQPYDVWVSQGHLRTTPGAAIDYDAVVQQLLDEYDGWDLQGIAFDRWRIEDFKAALRRRGAPEMFVDLLKEFGQGFASMSPALQALEAALLNGRLAHGGHPVLTMCAANAVTQTDPAGNRKLVKGKSSGRIDGMVALAMALGAAAKDQPSDEGYYSGGGELLVW